MADTTLKIDTILGEQQDAHDQGPLLLAGVQGIEGISIPFCYDVTMFQPLYLDDIDPRRMINTPVTMGLRGASSVVWKEEHEYTYRCGIFQTFEKDETNEKRWDDGLQTDFRIFRARIVPAFKMLDYEIRYRVFQDMDVLEIIEEVMQGFPNIIDYPNYVSTSLLKTESFPKIPYCVQFGESSLNFLSRLMAQFDIWYSFDHRHSSIKAANETMVLGKSLALFQQCRLMDMNIVYTAPEIDDIGGFQRSYVPARKHVWVSNFNMLHPTVVPRGEAAPDPTYDLLPKEGATPYQREFFPATFDDPHDTSEVMHQQAESRIEDEQGDVFVVQGQTKNPTFLAGRIFHVTQDKTKADPNNVGRPANNDYLITRLSFAAYEYAYGHYTGQDVVNFLDSPVRWIWSFFRKKNLSQGLFVDTAAALAGGGLSNWTQTQNITQTGHELNPDPYQMNFGDTFFAGMNASFVQALVQLAVVSNLKEVIANHGDDYSNAFFAVPWDADKYNCVPGPDAVKPRAYGPHLAVVIGPDGTDTSNGELYADGLGRVRVRFPWQREVQPRKGQQDSTDPLKSDRRTCWVRVSESWAGEHFGTQFLPRIGQEVIVSFVDGDPDRPIVTGRVYHTDDSSYANLPFPQGQVARQRVGQQDLATPSGYHDFRFTGLKTSSTPKPSASAKERYHLQRFDDAYDCEQYLVRSQGRLDVTAFAHSFKTTYGNQHIKVALGTDKNNQSFGGAAYTTIAGEYDLHVGDSKYQQVEKNYELTVKGNTQVDTKGDLTEIVKGQWSHGANEIVLEATQKITLKVGASWVVIDPSGVHITGPMVYINSGGGPGTRGALNMQDVMDATAAEPGDEPNKRLTDCNPGSGDSGARGTHTDEIRSAPSCEQVGGQLDGGDYGSSEAEALMSIEGGYSHDPNQGGSSPP